MKTAFKILVAACFLGSGLISGCSKTKATYVVATVDPDGQVRKRSFPPGTSYKKAESQSSYMETLIGIHPIELPGGRKGNLWLIRDEVPTGLEIDNQFYRIDSSSSSL